MKLKTVDISAYRQMEKVRFNMDKNITVIAGANNTGKTSLVELFNYVFGPVKGKICSDDFPVRECQVWSDKAYRVVMEAFSAIKSKDDFIAEVCVNIFTKSNEPGINLIPPLTVSIEVEYDKGDDLRNFSEYTMEFDEDKTSFYFMYQYEISEEKFKIVLDKEYDKLTTRLSKVSEQDTNLVRIIKEMLITFYAGSCDEVAYYADSTFENREKMEISSFKKLFNCNNIMAGRTLDDESSDRTQLLSKSMIDVASDEEGWKELLSLLPDQIIQPIQDARIQEKVRTASIDTLSAAIAAIAKTNGGHAGNIVIDMRLTEEAIHSLLKSITCARYQIDDYYLREASQGLGFSNLIYIHLQLERFRKKIDPLIVNFFIIEEPEAHMHPQMQRVFTEYLFDYYANQPEMQGFITTHSHEVVSSSKISQLRVLRQRQRCKCCLYDLHKFNNLIQYDKDLLDFYNWFYVVSFPDIIFADKVIMYEGDTERMLIKSLIASGEFEELKGQYISFVQVGGAYAYNYKKLIEFLELKTIIISDIDYDKKSSCVHSVLHSQTTNATINGFARDILNKATPTIAELYEWKKAAYNAFPDENNGTVVVGELIGIAFQSDTDGCSRTLEEAMLSKLFSCNAFEEKLKEEWKQLRSQHKLKFTVPRDLSQCSIRDIVSHTSSNKTDFMYSVVLVIPPKSGKAKSMLPNYIREALIWLGQ